MICQSNKHLLSICAFLCDAIYHMLQSLITLHCCRFIIWLTFVVLGVVCLALIGRVNRQTRSMLTGYMSVNLALLIIVTNRVYDLSHFSGHGRYYHSARATFCGFIFLDIGFFGLIYLLGLEF